MKIHEYQAKNLIKQYKIQTPFGENATSLNDALNITKKIGYPCLMKAQVHAGGRGKAGGIKMAKNQNDVEEFFKKTLGKNLVTKQSDMQGQPINSILLEQPSTIIKELYFGIVIDREYNKICMIVSSEGGMDIEAIAENTPEKIIKQWVNIFIGIQDYHIHNMYNMLHVKELNYKYFHSCVKNFYKMFVSYDISLLEINPLAIVENDNNLFALDAKIVFDDNALYRMPSISQLADEKQENERETLANKSNLNYIALDGSIGCLVNGAGLAMSTMDVIKYVGGSPANFLDVGGSATKDNVKDAFKIILSDNKVKSVLINIFGGIARCDIIAAGIVDAAKEINLDIPLIVRLEGTKSQEGKAILSNSNLNITAAYDLLDAAHKAVSSISNV